MTLACCNKETIKADRSLQKDEDQLQWYWRSKFKLSEKAFLNQVQTKSSEGYLENLNLPILQTAP